MSVSRRASAIDAHGGLSGDRGEALVVNDPLVRRLAEPLPLLQRAHQQGDRLLASSGLGERENLRRGRDPVRAERAVLVQQPPVAIVRDECVGIPAELAGKLGAAGLEVGADFRLPRRVRLEQVTADVDPQPLEAAGDVPERREAPHLFLDQEPAAGLDLVELPGHEDAEAAEHEQRHRQEEDEAPGDRHGFPSRRRVRSSGSFVSIRDVGSGEAASQARPPIIVNFGTSRLRLSGRPGPARRARGAPASTRRRCGGAPRRW